MDNKETTGQKPKGAIALFMLHSTTIIAIIMTLITMQAERIDLLKDKAETQQDAVTDKRDEIADEITDVEDKETELYDLYDEDTTVMAFRVGMRQVQSKNATLTARQKDVLAMEQAQQEILSNASEKENTSNWAQELSQLAILLSSTGVASNKKFLQYLAGGFTLMSLVIILYTFMI